MDINPVIFSFKLFTIEVQLAWYGLIVMTGVIVGAWFGEREVRRRGESGEALFDAMIWAVVAGILGARLWYVVNATLGGNNSYLQDPMSIIRPPIAGLHFFGGLLLGGVALIIYLKRNGYDVWLFLDAVAPVTLLGQAIGRWGNFINQELYGPPTTLPWGIRISADNRIAPFSDLNLFPVETTRFHPTFAYEMILNVLAFLFILWYIRKDEENIKPGTAFSLWLIFAGFIRTFIEFFRPDQPRIGDSFVSYTMVVAFIMGVAGIILFLARHGKLQIPALENWEEEYQIKKVEKKTTPLSRKSQFVEDTSDMDSQEEIKEAKRKSTTKKPAVKKAYTKEDHHKKKND
jgi:phosphatidylglycerol:prolipoprotein diacylglycerol transferase